MPYPGTVKETGKAIALYGSSSISLSNVRAYGSLDGNPQNDGLGIYIQGSSGITVSGLNFPELHRGIGISRRSEEQTSELQSLMRTSYAVFYLTTNNIDNTPNNQHTNN